MRSYRHRRLGVALLPLLILAQLTGSGGWFCADGSRCELPLSATCCCGSAPGSAPLGESCMAGIGAGGASVSSAPCGCYYDARSLDCLQRATQAPATAAPVPAAFLTTVESPRLTLFSLTEEAQLPPPRFLASPRDTRAPPAS